MIAMTTKMCSRCREEKKASEFSKDKSKKSGLYARCKVCDRADGRQYYLKHRNKKLRKFKKYSQSESGKRVRNRNSKKYYAKHRDEYRARSQLNYAISTGRTEKGPCVTCGDVSSHGHHEDYSKPLEVIWLCRRCHTELHNVKRQAYLKQKEQHGE